MTTVNVAVFERNMTSNPILFETFWSEQCQREYCTGFSLTVNWSNPDPADVEVFHRLHQLIAGKQIGIHLERTDVARKIHFGIVGTPCYDPFTHDVVTALAEIELHKENTSAFDWMFDSMEPEEPEATLFCTWPNLTANIYEGFYEVQAEIPSRVLDPPLATYSRAGAIVRFFVETKVPHAQLKQ